MTHEPEWLHLGNIPSRAKGGEGRFSLRPVDDKLENFVCNLICLNDVHAPMRADKVKNHPSPWLTKDTKGICEQKVARSKLNISLGLLLLTEKYL